MLSKNTQINRDQIEIIALEQLVLQNNFLISICAKFTLTIIYTPGQRMVYNSSNTTKRSARRVYFEG